MSDAVISLAPIERVLDALAAAGDPPKPTRTGEYSARCPAHPDRDPSLTVREGDDGKVLLHCFAGCAPESIAAALCLEMRDLFPDSAEHEPRPVAALATKPVRYEYRNEDGQVVAVFTRSGVGKQFRWIGKKPEGCPVYRLPELRAAASTGERVFLVEGEKDADALRDLGLVATTLPNGAAAVWEPQHVAAFDAVNEMVILPDNDPPGFRYAMNAILAVGFSLPSVKVVVLPGLPAKGDVSDWLRNGGSREQLLALAETAPQADVDAVKARAEMNETVDAESQATPSPIRSERRRYKRPPLDVSAFETISANTVQITPVDWWWHRRARRHELTVLSGKPGTGKSTLALELVAAASRGDPLYPEEQARVPERTLWLSREETVQDVVAKARLARFADGKLEFPTQLMRDALLKRLGENDGADTFGRWLRVRGFDNLVVDGLIDWMGTLDSNEMVEGRDRMSAVVDMARNHRINVLAILHDKKGGEGSALDAIAGTVAHGAVPRNVNACYKVGTGINMHRYVVSPKANVGKQPPALEFRITGRQDDDYGWIEWLGEVEIDPDQIRFQAGMLVEPESKEDRFDELFPDNAWHKLSELSSRWTDEIGLGRRSLGSALARWLEEGRIDAKFEPYEGGIKWYRRIQAKLVSCETSDAS